MRRKTIRNWGVRIGSILLSACMLVGALPETLYAETVAEVSVSGNEGTENVSIVLADEYQDVAVLEETEESVLEILGEEEEEIFTYKPYEDAEYVLEYTFGEDGITIIGIEGMCIGELVLPDEIDGVHVVAIGDYAFAYGEYEGELKLPQYLTSIGREAFSWCNEFEGQLEFPEGLETIGSQAFYECDGFTGDLFFNDGLKTIGREAFGWCDGFNGDIAFPRSLLSIGNEAFEDCKGLSGELKFSEGLLSIGDYAFQNCTGITGKLILPNSLKSIGQSAFSNCSGITGSLILPDNLTTIGQFAFSDCTGLNGELKLPENITKLGQYAFNDCTNLTGDLIIPDSLTSIDFGVFYRCRGFNGTLKLPKNLTMIGASAFSNCTGLIGKLEIPESVAYIESMAFSSCSGFTGELMLPEKMKVIGSSAFSNCSGFTGKLKLPEGLKEVNGFWGCSGFTGELKIPDGVTSIGSGAFNGCSGLSGELEIPDSVTNIGDYAFQGCNFTGELKLPVGLQKLSGFGGNNFSGELIIPDGVTSIGDAAFRNCNWLSGELVIPESVTTIGKNAFDGCNGLIGKVEMPDNLVTIGDYAFNECSGLTGELRFPENLTRIGAYAFNDCSKLNGEIFIGANVTYIGKDAFAGIENVTIHAPKGSYGETYSNELQNDYIIMQTPSPLPSGYEQSTIVPVSEHWIQVLDKAGIPIFDAEVELIGEDGEYPFTYEDGYIKVEPTYENVNVTVKKDGVSKTTKFFMFASGGSSYVKLDYLGEGEAITNVILFEEAHNLLTEEYTVYTSEAAEGKISTISVWTTMGEADCYWLVQGNGLIAQSDTNKIAVNLAEVLEHDGGDVEVVIRKNDHELDRKKLNFKIMSEWWIRVEQEETVKFGSVISFPVSEDVPFIGGGNFEIDTMEEFPLKMEWGEDKCKIYIGGVQNYMDESVTKSAQEMWSDIQTDLNKNFNTDTIPTTISNKALGGLEPSIKLMGYGEGEITPESKQVKVELGVFLEIKCNMVAPFYAFIGPVPVYIDVEVGMAEKRNGAIKLIIEEGKLPESTLDMPYSTTAVLGAGAGVGVNDVICVEANGRGTIEFAHNPYSPFLKIVDSCTLQGELDARAVLLNMSYTKTWQADKFQLFPVPEDILRTYEDMDIYQASAYEVLARDYVLESTLSGEFSPIDVLHANENMTELSNGVSVLRALDDGTQVIINGLYPDAKPQLVSFDGVDYLFYLDDQTERGAEDRTALTYRMRTEDGWSEAKLVSDDATADFDFEVCSGADGVYVVWQNATESMAGIATLEDAAVRLELQAAKVVGEEVTLLAAPATTEGLAPISPSLVNQNGTVWACWYENSENNLLENFDGENSFYVQELVADTNETLSEGEGRKTLAVTDLGVTTVDFGMLNGELWGALTADTDNDMSTVTDREVFFMQDGSTYQVTENEVVDSNPQFGILDGKQVVMYYADGNFAVTEGMEEETTTIFEEQNGTISDSFQFISNGGTPVIVWKDAYIMGENAGQALTMMRYENGSWGTPFEAASTADSLVAYTVLTREENAVAGNNTEDAESEDTIEETLIEETVTGETTNGEAITIIYTARGELNGQEITRLYEVQPKERGTATITKLEYEENDYEPGVEFPMGISLINESSYDAEKVEMVIVDTEGNTVFTQTSEEALAAGAESLVTLTGFAPEDTGDLQNFTLLVYADDKLCDTHTFALGGADYLVTEKTTFDEGEEILNLRVKNQTKFAGSVKMTITPEGEETAILEKEYTDIPAGSSVNYLCKLQELWAQTTADTLVVQVTSTGRTEETTIDNTAKLYNLSRQTETVTVDLEQDEVALQPGETSQLTATVGTEDVADKTLYYISNNEECVVVDANGLLTAVGEGVATITVATVDGFTDSCVVTVAYPEVESITLSQETLTMKVGDTATLTAQVAPEDAKDKTLTWTSSNNGVATVANGTITAVGAGTATITVKAINGISAACSITVEKAEEPLKPYPFTDLPVNGEDWKYIGANYVFQKGIMSGVDEVTFAPDMVMNRAMFVQMLYSMEQKPEVSYEEVFTDVAEDAWYSSAVIWAVNNGVTAGVGEGLFGSETEISREQLALLLYKYAQLEGYEVSQIAELETFTDSEATSDWAAEALEWAVGVGIISGKPQEDGSVKLDPKATATRAECAAMMRKYCMEYVE